MTALTAARLRELLHYDPETGVFTRRIQVRGGKPAGSVAGWVSKKLGYVQVKVDGKTYYGHRLAVLYVTGEWPAEEVDHRHGVRSDNRWDELRPASDAQNRVNQHAARSDNRSGLVGVKKLPNGSHQARIRVGGKERNLGTFLRADDASAAYAAAKAVFHPFSAA